uniref:Ubiquitin-like modifier-activating enzyme 5 n=1 Tax=Tetraselmis sp. GSL018 TaxID=582737 RepID=A0A061QMJ4_9CHLO
MSEGGNKTEQLQQEISKLQAQIQTLDAAGLQEQVHKLSSQVQRMSSRIKEAVASTSSSLEAMSSPGKVSPQQFGNAAMLPQPRAKIDRMSAEVVDSNPYSRLMALQRMGIVENYEKIREKRVAVVGMGGVGSVAAEMLARCGVGGLLMYDYDTVELANMNRLFFRPEQAGMTKTNAAAQTLGAINPDVELEPYTMNITTVDGYSSFVKSLSGPDGSSRVDLILSCVDNYEARMTINQAALEMGQSWMESGVSEDAVSGHIQFLVPGRTACFECAPPLVVASGIDESTLKREGVCAASLPTTMGIVAGLLVQNALKYLLGFGSVSPYLGYNSLKDFFPSYTVRPNPQCGNPLCCEAQTALEASWSKNEDGDKAEPVAGSDSGPVVHEDNEWGITVSQGEAEDTGADEEPEGLKYELPKSQAGHADAEASMRVETGGVGIDDLMVQLASLQRAD